MQRRERLRHGMASLEGPRAKAERAKHHLDQLVAEYCALFKITRVGDLALTEAGEIVSRYEQDDEGRWLVFGRAVPDLPASWGLILGDALHNARSALDLLVCQLVELNGRVAVRSNAFPIYGTAPNGQQQKKRFSGYFTGLGAHHAAGIRALQPYKNPTKKDPREGSC